MKDTTLYKKCLSTDLRYKNLSASPLIRTKKPAMRGGFF